MGARNRDVGLTAVVQESGHICPGKDMEPHREGSEKQEQQELAKKVGGSPFQSIDSMKVQTVQKSAQT